MKTIVRLITVHPLITGLFLFNTGVFAWLQTTASSILANLRLADDWSAYLPSWVSSLTGDSLPAFQGLVGGTAWAWLVLSMLVLLVIHFIKGLIKLILILLLVGIGLYLLFQHQDLLRGLLAG